MKRKSVIIIIVLLVILIAGVFMLKKGNRGSEIVESDDDFSEALPKPAGPYVEDGTIDLYFKNKTGQDVDKINIIAYGAENNVLSTTEVSGEDTEENENGIISINIPDDEDAKWDLTITIDGIEYKVENLVDEEIIHDQGLIPFSVENNKLIIEHDEWM